MYDLIIKNCSVMMPDFSIKKEQDILIQDSFIVKITDTDDGYESKEVLNGKNKLVMPGLVDGHTHTCQQLLRGRTANEYPMVWTRILVPYESSLTPEDCYWSAKLACLEMIKSGTTAFAESGSTHMGDVANAVIESGMRAALARSTMDIGDAIPDCMKESSELNILHTEALYDKYQGTGDGRVDIWFAIRQVMTCSPELIREIGKEARRLKTGIHAHLCEHKDEVSFCLQHYQKRPAEFLDDMGVLGPNLLTAHNVVLSERDIDLLGERNVKLIHCPRANYANHGFPKTPRILQNNMSLGLGCDGASRPNLSLFAEMKHLLYGTMAFWGIPIFDPDIICAKDLLKMVTVGGARALQHEAELGTIEEGKKADLITINLMQPHLTPTHNLLNTLVDCAAEHDVTDSVINGKIVMRDRNVLTMNEEEIIKECSKRMKQIAERSGI
ncbi:MAG: amidohydrolase [Lachnospiraceae bacterium]|jgi:5-methylthioadenosine/S-adenosylhomocysteine deaminase|nr:MAG: amidohydrolase [Lachnospiraceae bacterium]